MSSREPGDTCEDPVTLSVANRLCGVCEKEQAVCPAASTLPGSTQPTAPSQGCAGGGDIRSTNTSRESTLCWGLAVSSEDRAENGSPCPHEASIPTQKGRKHSLSWTAEGWCLRSAGSVRQDEGDRARPLCPEGCWGYVCPVKEARPSHLPLAQARGAAQTSPESSRFLLSPCPSVVK